MSSILWKTFNLCFSKFKCFPTIAFPPPPVADEHDDTPATTNPTLLKNFNSLYDTNYSDFSTSKSLTFSSTTTTAAAAAEDDLSSSSSSGFSDDDLVPDFTSAFASHRFFFSSPGSSNSIFQPLEQPPPPEDHPAAVVSGGVAVQTFSPDPYADFRNSMVEMIETRDFKDVKNNWEFLNELLLCYLTLNPKHTHKFIVSAFADVVVSLQVWSPSLLSSSDDGGRTHLQRHSATARLSI